MVHALRSFSKPLVYTVHDLENPHVRDQAAHYRALDLLVREADQIVTLTSRAAARIDEKYRRRAAVFPHPHVAPFSVMARSGRLQSWDKTQTLGIHLKSLRPSIDAVGVLGVMGQILRTAPTLRLYIDINDDARAAVTGDLRSALETLSRSAQVTVRTHRRFTDGQLWRYLESLDAVILPYSTSTHSGWAEACYDLGVGVIAPQHTCIPDQHSEFETFDILAPSTLAAAIDRVCTPRVGGLSRALSRGLQRVQLSRAMDKLYCELL